MMGGYGMDIPACVPCTTRNVAPGTCSRILPSPACIPAWTTICARDQEVQTLLATRSPSLPTRPACARHITSDVVPGTCNRTQPPRACSCVWMEMPASRTYLQVEHTMAIIRSSVFYHSLKYTGWVL